MSIETSPAVTLVCPEGHMRRVPAQPVRSRRATETSPLAICRECHQPMEPRTVKGPPPTTSNHRRVPAPPPPEPCLTVDSKPQCGYCAAGDHGRCNGVGCFCGTSPSTRDVHHATNHRYVDWDRP